MSVETVVTEGDLAEMVEQVWVSYLDPEGINPLVVTGDNKQTTEVHSAVSITGTWHGHLVYACSMQAAKKSAAGFLAMGMDEVGQEDISDVLGELANIVGGNVKAMLPAGCFLSLPTVVLAPDTASYYPSAEVLSGLYGIWDGEPISITMYQSIKQQEGAA
ncbi:chemotaxis protein CheX [Actinoplanes sp. NPDC051346]|uniref:chemotaxis protein CheX n=1 Tax=Actinoplanes sp. NPDC051346 TaxID=3155048 RepID=UPI003420F706